jgi:Ca2+/Na+ antiporter
MPFFLGMMVCLNIRDLEKKKKLFILSFTSHFLLLRLLLFSFLLLRGRVHTLHVSLLFLLLFALIRTIVGRQYEKPLRLLTELVVSIWLGDWLKLVLYFKVSLVTQAWLT